MQFVKQQQSDNIEFFLQLSYEFICAEFNKNYSSVLSPLNSFKRYISLSIKTSKLIVTSPYQRIFGAYSEERRDRILNYKNYQLGLLEFQNITF